MYYLQFLCQHLVYIVHVYLHVHVQLYMYVYIYIVCIVLYMCLYSTSLHVFVCQWTSSLVQEKVVIVGATLGSSLNALDHKMSLKLSVNMKLELPICLKRIHTCTKLI